MATPSQLSDRTWRLNNLYHIMNKKGVEIVFRLNPEQQILADNMWYLNLILKARQLGMTTFICILFLDSCLFNSNIRAGIIAHNREDAEIFFRDKIKYAYDRLPEALRTELPAKSDSVRELVFSNNSSIRVGTSLRSGTLQLLHISEFGKICAQFPHKAEEIVTGAINTVQVGQYIFIESTAEGSAGYFFDYCQDSIKAKQAGQKLSPLQFRFHFFPWWVSPDYRLDPKNVTIPGEMKRYFDELATKYNIPLDDHQKAWYTDKWRVQRDKMKREYPSYPDEAFHASVEGRYYQREMQKVREQQRITVVPHVEGVPINLGWDLGIDDEVTMWFHQRVRAEERIVRYEHGSDEGLVYYFRKLQELRETEGYIYGRIYLPHDAAHRSLQTGKSVEDLFRESGFTDVYIVPRTHDLLASIEETRRFFGVCWFDEALTEAGVKALDNYSKEQDKINGGFKPKPKHDEHSHGADGFRTLACGLQDIGPGRDTSGSKDGKNNSLLRRRRGRSGSRMAA